MGMFNKERILDTRKNSNKKVKNQPWQLHQLVHQIILQCNALILQSGCWFPITLWILIAPLRLICWLTRNVSSDICKDYVHLFPFIRHCSPLPRASQCPVGPLMPKVDCTICRSYIVGTSLTWVALEVAGTLKLWEPSHWPQVSYNFELVRYLKSSHLISL